MSSVFEMPELFQRTIRTLEARGRDVIFRDARIKSPMAQAEAFRYFLRVCSAGMVSQIEGHDAAYPQFIKILSPWLNWGYPNPDGTYSFSPLDGSYEYRLFGNRGQARLFDIEIWEGDIADLKNARSIGGKRDIYRGKSDLEIAEDGTFEVSLCAQERPGNWIQLPPGYGHLYVRQWYYDYENERPGEFYIERIGAQYPRPALTAADHSQNFERFIGFVDSVFETLDRGISLHYQSPPDIVPFLVGLIQSEKDGHIAFRNQSYGRGRFTCAPDEAVILEAPPPSAEYWMFGLLSSYWESFDWLGRQISINGHQAVIDEDGIFRAVISHRDPGVSNWLDACGHTEGLIAARYNWSDDVPTPTLRTVKVDELMRNLPPSTKRITAAERSELLRRRSLSQRRRGVDW